MSSSSFYIRRKSGWQRKYAEMPVYKEIKMQSPVSGGNLK